MGAGKETIQDKTDKVTSQAKSLVNQAQAQVPPPVARRVHHLTAAVRQRPVSVTAMVLTVIALVLLCPVLSAEANEDHSMVPGSFLVVGVDEWPVMNQSSDDGSRADTKIRFEQFRTPERLVRTRVSRKQKGDCRA